MLIRHSALPMLLVLFAAVSPARAASPFELNLRLDLPVMGLGAAFSLLALVEVAPPACFPGCDASRINAIDRSVLGNYSESAHTAADLGVAALLTLPLLWNAIDGGGSGFIEDTVVYAETLLLAQALTQLSKFAARRTAPFAYDPDAPAEAISSKDAARSFISGHTTMAFAATTAFSVTYWLRHPDDPLRWVIAGVGAALAAGVAVLKIAAGYHFITDVVAGALVGVGIGTLVPLLHTRTPWLPR